LAGSGALRRLLLAALGFGFAACRVVYDFPSGEDATSAGAGAGGSAPSATGSTAASSGTGVSGCLSPPTHVYSSTFGGDEVDELSSLAFDPVTQAVYGIGHTESSSFGLPSGPPLPGADDIYTDMFLLKLAADGQVAWAKLFGSASTACNAGFRQRGQAVAVDPHGNVVVTGRFDCTMDFSDGGSCDTSAGCLIASGASTMTNTPPPDIFVAELDPDGHALWAHSYGDAAYGEDVWDLAVDAKGSVVLIGKYVGAMNLGVPPLPTSNGEHRGFIATLDDDGNNLWSRSVAHVCNASHGLTCRVATDSAGDIYWFGDFAGGYSGPLDFGAAAPLVCPCPSGGFRVKYGSEGSVDWQTCTLETCDAGASFVVTDVVAAPDDSRVIVTGRLRGTADFGLGAVSAKGDDAVLLEVDVATGAAKRVALFGGEDDEVVVAAGFDAQGGLALLGNFWGSWSAGPCALSKVDPTSPWSDAFLLHIDADFQPDWAGTFGNAQEQGARDLAIAPDGSFVVGLRVQGTLDLGGGPLPDHGTYDDVLLARLRAPTP
jgi:hypothetical protein